MQRAIEARVFGIVESLLPPQLAETTMGPRPPHVVNTVNTETPRGVRIAIIDFTLRVTVATDSFNILSVCNAMHHALRPTHRSIHRCRKSTGHFVSVSDRIFFAELTCHSREQPPHFRSKHQSSTSRPFPVNPLHSFFLNSVVPYTLLV